MYRKNHCRAKIRYYPAVDIYVHVDEHSHEQPHMSKNQPTKLDESRRQEVADFVKRNTHIKSAKSIAETLNKSLSNEDLTQAKNVVTTHDVQEIRKKFYSDRVSCLQDLYSRPDLSETKSKDQFVRWVQGFPYFLLIYASNYQMNLLKSITSEDQIYVDGTFDVCPEGCEQMLTIHIRKKGHDKAIPSMFIFLNRKDFDTYWFCWWVISNMLIPELQTIQKLYVACDFELAMHNALKSHFKDVEIVGCHFHLLQAITRWIKHTLPKDNLLKKDLSLKKEFKDELLVLARTKYEPISRFYEEKNHFLSKWRTIGGFKFYQYLHNTWLSDEARFSPQIWAYTLLTSKSDRYESLDQTNNQAEVFHHHLNGKFSERPQLKRAIQIIQEIEHTITNDDMSFKRKSLSSSLVGETSSSKKKRSLSTFKLVSNENSKRKKLNNREPLSTVAGKPLLAITESSTSNQTNQSSNSTTSTLQQFTVHQPLELMPPPLFNPSILLPQITPTPTIQSQQMNSIKIPPFPKQIHITQPPSNQLIFETYSPEQHTTKKKRGRKPKSTQSMPTNVQISTPQIPQHQNTYPQFPFITNNTTQTLIYPQSFNNSTLFPQYINKN